MGATTLTADGWGRVPRTYVTCTLDASHSPFLSMPDVVADVIGKLG